MVKIIFLAGCILVVAAHPTAEAWAGKYLFHATRKAVAAKIAQGGFSVKKMQAGARFGRGVYLSGSQATARAEKSVADAMVRAQKGKGFQQRVLDLSRPNAYKLRAFSAGGDLRGAVKHNIIGPKIGHKIGHQAEKAGRIIRYQSARKPGGSNYFVPKSLYEKHPRIIHDVKVNAVWR
jgi:hypothetical protein